MTRHLIVANQTLGGAALDREVTQRAQGGRAHFFVLVPMIEPELEDAEWAANDAVFGIGTDEAGANAIALAHRRSRHRLDAMIGRIAELGGTAEGEVGDPDPVRAVRDVVARQDPFDIVLVSTLPAGVSKWLKLDLVSRVDRMVPCPVVTVEADDG